MLDLLDESPGELRIVEAFYARFVERPDDDLKPRKLPRQEVLEGLEPAADIEAKLRHNLFRQGNGDAVPWADSTRISASS